MSLEAQLLQIIEQQQMQLKNALERLEAQSMNIEQLQKYTTALQQHTELLAERNKEQALIIKKLQDPQLSADLLQNLENSLKLRLQSHLEQLVTGLNIESQAKTLIMNSLPNMVQAEIKNQVKPLVLEFLSEKDKIKSYHDSLANLIQQLSSRL